MNKVSFSQKLIDGFNELLKTTLASTESLDDYSLQDLITYIRHNSSVDDILDSMDFANILSYVASYINSQSSNDSNYYINELVNELNDKVKSNYVISLSESKFIRFIDMMTNNRFFDDSMKNYSSTNKAKIDDIESAIKLLLDKFR